MSLLEDVKKYAEKATGWHRPNGRELPDLIRKRKPNTVRFKPDGFVPT